MPATATRHTAEESYHCYRCGKDKPRTGENWYFRSDGSIISACKLCHGKMAEERRARRSATPAPAPASPANEARAPGSTTLMLPLGIVEDARPEPTMIQYRCEGCGRGSISANPEGPRGWKRVRLTVREGDSPATLCPRCTAAVARAFQVVKAVSQRRAAGRGKSH